jgi:hypothetical protein
MKIWFTLIDFSMPLVMAYLVLRKGSLSIVYVPFLFFMYSMLEKSKIIPIYHLLFIFLLVYYSFLNLPFLKKNVFYLILILFFTYQLQTIDNLKEFRMYIIGLYWTLTIVALAPEICRNYSREKIFKELSLSAFLILLFFIANSSISTFFKYYPEKGYGFTSGISFGNISIAHYNILPLALYLVFKQGMKNKKLVFFAVGIAALILTMLTLRRSVMAISLFSCLIVMIEFLTFKQIKQFTIYFLVLGMVGFILLKTTGFSNELMDRFEARNIKDRDLEEEGRYIEFGLIYKDMFVYYDYDPWFGYGPLKSWGNYGKGAYGNRNLHSNITYFIHGFGFFGLFLLISMVSMVFYQAWLRIYAKSDRFLFAFIIFYFVVFTILGIPKLPLSPVYLFMMLGLLFGKLESPQSDKKLNQNIGIKTQFLVK